MPQVSQQFENMGLDSDCLGQRYWYAFLMSSLITFFGGLFIIICWRLFTYFCYGHGGKRLIDRVSIDHDVLEYYYFYSCPSCFLFFCLKFFNRHDSQYSKDKKSFFNRSSDPEIGWVTTAKDWAGELISGQSTSGRILVRNNFIAKTTFKIT